MNEARPRPTLEAFFITRWHEDEDFCERLVIDLSQLKHEAPTEAWYWCRCR